MKRINALQRVYGWLNQSRKDFIAAWGETPTWILNHNLGAIEFYLLQDIKDPRRFISTGSWESLRKIEAWWKLPESAKFIAKMKELCDEAILPVPVMKL